MLVLTRKVGETILIGENIKITLVRIEDDQVRIGISAPKDVPVYRKELFEEAGAEVLEELSKTKPPSTPKSKDTPENTPQS